MFTFFFYLVIKFSWHGSRVWRVSSANFVVTRQFFFYLVIKLSQHESKVWRVNLIWRVNPVNSDFFFFFFINFFFPFGFFLINLFNYHTFMTRPCSQIHIQDYWVWYCSQIHIQDYWVWYCSQTHLNLGHASLILLLIL